jgi:N-acetylneuraminic acid mutarotase
MKRGTNKFLITVFASLMAFSVVTTPFLAIEKVNADNDGSWTTLAPLPMETSAKGVALALNEKIYYMNSNMTLCYDPKTNNWTKLSPPPIPKGGVYAACQNKIYVLGGSAGVPTRVYDPATDTWEIRASTHETRGIVHANVVDGKIYVMGGQYLGFITLLYPVSSNYVYDPETDTWSQMADIPVGVGGYASAVVDGKIYIISGGMDFPHHPYTNLVQIFDPATNHWTNGTSIPTFVYNARACVITEPSGEKRIHVIGGQLRYSWQVIPDIDGVDLHQVYDPETDTWTNATTMPTPRTGLGLATINNEIYAIGGEHNGTLILANEKYNPSDPSGYIPEFPTWIVLPLVLVVTLFSVVVKRKFHKVTVS